jgi:Ca-activated chloride channel family protein
MLAVAVATAGPTWNKQPSPWFSETAPLVIALEVSDSMRANDLQPNRLERARFKILDLLALRTGARTALIAYAGSAHVVMPPTTDLNVLKPFLESLDPAIMPVVSPNRSVDAGKALALAVKLLGTDTGTATVLFVNDGFEATDVPAFEEHSKRPGAPATIALVLGTESGGVALMPDGSPVIGNNGARLDTSIDEAVLGRIQSEASTVITRTTTNDADLRTLLAHIESRLRQADDPDAQWRDQAWWLLFPAALLTLLWFRRGWTMQW